MADESLPPSFFEEPIRNSPYEYPKEYWELDGERQPTNRLIPRRRRGEFITPIPKPKKRKRGQEQRDLAFWEDKLSTNKQRPYGGS